MKYILVKIEGSPVQYPLTHDKNLSLKAGDLVVADSDNGLQLVEVLSSESKKVKEIEKMSFEEAVENVEKNSMSFIRLATKNDINIYNDNKNFSEDVKNETKRFIKTLSRNENK